MRLLDDLGSAVALRSEPNLTERVTERLLSQLTAGQYQPGDVLPSEQLIAEHMGVSRTVLREAVARLKAEGYVISKQGRGLIVQASRRPTVLKMHAAEAGDYNEALSIVELRQGFEMVAAALAAQRRTPDDLEMMHDAVDRMRVAIRTGEPVAEGLVARPIGEHSRALYAAPSYLQRKGIPLIPDDLHGHCTIAVGSPLPALDWRLMDKGVPRVVKLQPRLTTNGNESAIAAALNGFGLTRVISYQVADYLRDGRLKTVLTEFEPPALPVHVVHREGRHASRKARAFIDLAIERLRANPALN